MLKLKTIILSCIFATSIIPQGGGEPEAERIEIFFGIFNAPHPNSYTFYLDGVGTVWAANDNFEPPGFFINQDPDIDHSNYPWYVRELVCNQWRGWNMVYSLNVETIDDTTVPVYGYGLYKMSTNASSAYFYIDYRDARIPYPPGSALSRGDHTITYDFNDHSFSVGPLGCLSTEPVTNGEYIKFWELQEMTPLKPSTAEFPDFWENCLVIIKDVNNHIKLVWGPYPDDNFGVTHYRIYRQVDFGNWYLSGIVNSETFSYTDNEIVVGRFRGLVKYYIKAYNGSTESEPTNTVWSTYEQYNPHKVGTEKLYKKPKAYYLEQNYPNPFNPSTSITYSLKNEGFVSLKVYDILGNEVASLVSENQPAGHYTVQFNGSKLSDGIYFYTITSGKFTDTKKLILLK